MEARATTVVQQFKKHAIACEELDNILSTDNPCTYSLEDYSVARLISENEKLQQDVKDIKNIDSALQTAQLTYTTSAVLDMLQAYMNLLSSLRPDYEKWLEQQKELDKPLRSMLRCRM